MGPSSCAGEPIRSRRSASSPSFVTRLAFALLLLLAFGAGPAAAAPRLEKVGDFEQPVWAVGAPGDRLQRGRLGILEPSAGAKEVIPDILLVPLAAFDRAGHRIGYGAGHYDRTLEQLRKLKAITAVGVAAAVQEVEAVPALLHDAALDYVLTETQVIDFRSL